MYPESVNTLCDLADEIKAADPEMKRVVLDYLAIKDDLLIKNFKIKEHLPTGVRDRTEKKEEGLEVDEWHKSQLLAWKMGEGDHEPRNVGSL